MQLLIEGFGEAIRLILTLNGEVIEITWLSLRLSGIATLASLLVGLPLGTLLALGRFPGRRLMLSMVNTGMALPPVVVGLAVSLALWRSGPLGFLHLIYTPVAIVIAQVIIATPLVIGLTASAMQQLEPLLQTLLLGLGASRAQMILALWREARLPLLAALMAGFGSIISEVGAAMMVGGNLRYHTRVLTTAIVLESSRGNFALAIALSIILLGLAYGLNLAFTLIQQQGQER